MANSQYRTGMGRDSKHHEYNPIVLAAVGTTYRRGLAGMRTGKYKYGVRNPSSKLDDNMVRAIRNSKDTGTIIAERYGITTATVCHIRTRQTWKHVE
jgi:hypothetical protein